jgi:glycosyltransferase involved in cell wall biosynthesis
MKEIKKLVLVADGRSPITKSWIKMLQPTGIAIHLISTFPCQPVEGAADLYTIPIAFSKFAGSQAGNVIPPKPHTLVSRFRGIAAQARHWLGPWTVAGYAQEFTSLVNSIEPDLVHALRIPFEGMLARFTPVGIPLILSTWGNDFTLHAPATAQMGKLTHLALNRADGLMSDTVIDITRANEWGFNQAKPVLTIAGNGGINLREIADSTKGIFKTKPAQVINPRGIRSYVRNDTFFKAIPLILAQYPAVQFVCASMAGQAEALDWIEKLGIEKNVRLLPMIPQAELWQEFARSRISVSISTHDGTPNSLLEAMALGCLPVCGDLPSIREWITDGENGLLVDPADPKALAAAIVRGLNDEALCLNAAVNNEKICHEIVNIDLVRIKVLRFYSDLIK